MNGKKLTVAAAGYFVDLARVRASGGAMEERSSFVPLTGLLHAVRGMLKPTVFCVSELPDQCAGHHGLELYAASQVRGGHPRQRQLPERGVTEVKSSRQLERTGYGAKLADTLAGMASCDEAFDRLLTVPRSSARPAGTAFGEYLARALSHQATIRNPGDLA